MGRLGTFGDRCLLFVHLLRSEEPPSRIERAKHGACCKILSNRRNVLKLYWLPTAKAAITLKKGDPSQAIRILEAAAPYELGSPPPVQVGTLYPAYLRGNAYLLAHNATAAVAEFQKVISHPGVVVNFVTASMARLQIARAYALAGDTAKAKSAYQGFLTIWRDADPDVPVLQEAKAEYAKLQ